MCVKGETGREGREGGRVYLKIAGKEGKVGVGKERGIEKEWLWVALPPPSGC